MSSYSYLSTLLLAAACATDSGTRPGDMSRTDHEAAAKAHEAVADRHHAD